MQCRPMSALLPNHLFILQPSVRLPVNLCARNPFIHSFIHSFIPSVIQLFLSIYQWTSHPHTKLKANAPILSYIHSGHSPIHSSLPLFINSSIHSSTHSSIHASICLSIHQDIQSSVRPSIHTFIQPYIYLSIHSSIHPFIESKINPA